MFTPRDRKRALTWAIMPENYDEQIRTLRRARGLSQAQLATLVGAARKAVVYDLWKRPTLTEQDWARCTSSAFRRASVLPAPDDPFLHPKVAQRTKRMCCNLQKATRARLVKSAGLRLMPPLRVIAARPFKHAFPGVKTVPNPLENRRRGGNRGTKVLIPIWPRRLPKTTANTGVLSRIVPLCPG